MNLERNSIHVLSVLKICQVNISLKRTTAVRQMDYIAQLISRTVAHDYYATFHTMVAITAINK